MAVIKNVSHLNHIALTVLLLVTQLFGGGHYYRLGAEAYQQELNLYDDVTGNSFTYHTHVSDSSFLDSTVNRICYLGIWSLFKEVDFESIGLGRHTVEGTRVCENLSFPLKSFRYGGANDTSVSTASFYTGQDYTGLETRVSGLASGLLAAGSFIITGTSSWTLFEGSNFDGNSLCVTPPGLPSQVVASGHPPDGWAMVGSVVKFCED